MTVSATPPDGVGVVEHCWIAMPDGVRLAARIWMPPEDIAGPYPALLEYIPYRRRDMVRARDERNHPFFAAHGYVCLRVDMRGSGDSEGRMPDMYCDDELGDARVIIAWIAAQPWCSGSIGMFGTSWGGTASLQAAVDAPAALKAVLANCATSDRFDDDIHYMGGCLLTDGIEWGATLPAILAAPPDAATVGPDWRRLWGERLRTLAFPLGHWVREKFRGDYWRHGSVRFAYDRLSCPILAIGGWSDRYSNTVLPLVTARPDICWGVVGPWGHHYPDQGEPGPALGFQRLALAWWDHWLKTSEPAALRWPKLRLWRREFDPPQDRLAVRAGGWIEADDVGDATAGGARRWYPASGVLLDTPAGGDAAVAVPFDVGHGERAGDTGYFGRVGGLPLDQAADDARAVCFDSAPLAAPLDLVGGAVFAVDIARQKPQAQLVCRLCDVAPDGRSCLVTRTAHHLGLDEHGDADAPFEAGRRQRVAVRFPTAAYRFHVGHRVRLSLAASYWPLVWPTAADPSLRAFTTAGELVLPAAPAAARPLATPLPDALALPAVPGWRVVEAGALRRTPPGRRAGVLCSGWHQRPVAIRFDDTATTFRVETAVRYRIDADEPAAARCVVRYRLNIERPDGVAAIRSDASVNTCRAALRLRGRLVARWQNVTVGEKRWKYALSR